jgi:hypothetical protein
LELHEVEVDVRRDWDEGYYRLEQINLIHLDSLKDLAYGKTSIYTDLAKRCLTSVMET